MAIPQTLFSLLRIVFLIQHLLCFKVKFRGVWLLWLFCSVLLKQKCVIIQYILVMVFPPIWLHSPSYSLSLENQQTGAMAYAQNLHSFKPGGVLGQRLRCVPFIPTFCRTLIMRHTGFFSKVFSESLGWSCDCFVCSPFI